MNIKDSPAESRPPIPSASSVDAIRWAASFAELVELPARRLVAEVKIEVPAVCLGNALMNISALAGAEMKKSKENASELLAAFTEEAGRHGLPHETIHESCLVGVVPNLLADYARLRDLTIIPMPADDKVDQGYAETVVFQSGRPVLIVPEHLPRAEAQARCGCGSLGFQSNCRACRCRRPSASGASKSRADRVRDSTKNRSDHLAAALNWRRIYPIMGSMSSSTRSMPETERSERS